MKKTLKILGLCFGGLGLVGLGLVAYYYFFWPFCKMGEVAKYHYYESGALEHEIPCKNGKMEGIWKAYYESGALRSETHYENGKLEGIRKEYYESGALEYEGSHINGKKEGVVRGYYESGALKSEVLYKNGKMEGVVKEYYESGALKWETLYRNGKMIEIIRSIADADMAVRTRPEIVDRNGAVIALDLPAFDIYVDKSFSGDPKDAGSKAAALLNLPLSEVVAKIEAAKKHGKFAYIARKVLPEARNLLSPLGFGSLPSKRRVYPDGDLFRHLLGSVDTDGFGTSGIEKYLDSSGLVSHGKVQLSVDRYIQTSVRTNLAIARKEWGAKEAAGIVMDVQSGEILALVSLPDEHAGQDSLYANHVTNSRYEPGSVMKIFNHALAIENNYPRSKKFDVAKPFYIGAFLVRDSHPPKPVINMDEAFIYSSNIASAQIAMDIGAARQAEFFKKLGFFDPVALELPELGRPSYPFRWTDVSTATAAYGYGIAITPLHILIAANSIVNFGMSVRPTLLKRSLDEPRRYVQMVGFDTAREMKALMERTAEKTANAKVSVIGKTGTTQKLVNGEYSPDHVRTFSFSAFPADTPRYTMLIMLDEAKNNGCLGASCTAAEVSRRIIDEIEPLLNLYKIAPEFLLRDFFRAN